MSRGVQKNYQQLTIETTLVFKMLSNYEIIFLWIFFFPIFVEFLYLDRSQNWSVHIFGEVSFFHLLFNFLYTKTEDQGLILSKFTFKSFRTQFKFLTSSL